MNGLQNINIELTSRCNKECAMCGRRKEEKEFPWIVKNRGDMDFALFEKIAKQIPRGIFIQLHNNGEPLLYSQLGAALSRLGGNYVGLNTNGKLLFERRTEIATLSSVTISVIPDDPEGVEQLQIAAQYLEVSLRPLVVFRLLGEIDIFRKSEIERLRAKFDKVVVCKRILHKPEGSFGYEKPVTIPEIGVCLEMLHKLAIDRHGNVYPCVRFDPDMRNLLGNAQNVPLADIWNSVIRKLWIQYHVNGRRERVSLCSECHFWGVPRG
jgi:radical SAM protein with 4Fe4S-binding SPASM domain